MLYILCLECRLVESQSAFIVMQQFGGVFLPLHSTNNNRQTITQILYGLQAMSFMSLELLISFFPICLGQGLKDSQSLVPAALGAA